MLGTMQYSVTGEQSNLGLQDWSTLDGGKLNYVSYSRKEYNTLFGKSYFHNWITTPAVSKLGLIEICYYDVNIPIDYLWSYYA